LQVVLLGASNAPESDNDIMNFAILDAALKKRPGWPATIGAWGLTVMMGYAKAPVIL